MPGNTTILGFVAAALAVLLIPGAGVLCVVARSLGQGQRAGPVSVLGLSAGALVHVAAATVGLSAILLASATAFNIVKLLGAGYLIYLGVRILLKCAPVESIKSPAHGSCYRFFTDGLIVSVLNPKIAIFFLAFLPQFVDPASGSISQQIFLLGLLYVALAFFTDGAYVLLTGRARLWFSGQALHGPIPRHASGFVYLGLGLGMALTDRRQ